jgi:hypothetical protein
VNGIQQGNPDLRAKVGRTWTAGLVLRLGIIPLGAGWYDIRIVAHHYLGPKRFGDR